MNSVYYACKDNNNFGDILSKWLCEKITGQSFEFDSEKKLFISGSILQEANEETIVMGSGFGKLFQTTISKNILCVRGNLTRIMINEPAMVFEPAFCLREFFEDTATIHEVGFLPHYVDNDKTIFDWAHQIDILSGVENVVKEILSCNKIITSSLHGLAVADLFNRPTVLVKTIEPIDTDGFKYIDYWSFTGQKPYSPVDLNDNKLIDLIIDKPVLHWDKSRSAKIYLELLRRVLE